MRFRTVFPSILAILATLLICAGLSHAADEGAFLEKQAEQSVITGNYPRAVALLRGLAALRPRDGQPVFRLAEVYTLAGLYEEAIIEYRRYLGRPNLDAGSRARAQAEAKRLEEAPAPFAEQVFRQVAATEEAMKMFAFGKRDAEAKQYDQAIAELQASLMLDPDLPGPYRLLGAVYGKTGDRAQEKLFLADYLRVRPDGKIADTVRALLKNDHVMGTISLDGSWPCKIYVNGRDLSKQTPLKGFQLPAGKYVVDIVNEKYQTIYRWRADVVVGKDAFKKFNFGVLSTQLEPWARIRVDGKDVGLFPEIGIPEGKHVVAFRAHDGSQEKTVELDMKGGAREQLSW